MAEQAQARPKALGDFYPFKSHYLDREGLSYHYVDEGSGDPILMVHGNPTWSIYYRALVGSLGHQYRCIVPDHMGCGLSDKPNDDAYEYTLSKRVDDLEALMDHLEIHQDLTLVLHDWGGMIGMALATRRPNLVKRIVLLNTAAFANPRNQGLPLSIWLARNTMLGAVLVRGFNAFQWGAMRFGCTRTTMSRALRKAYTSPHRGWADRIAILRFVQDIPLVPTDSAFDELATVEASLSQFSDRPILICWGEKDFVFDGPFLARWEGIYPDAQVIRFSDCGHLLMEDAPQDVCAAVSNFLLAHPLDREEAS